jgi:hypothetical protein
MVFSSVANIDFRKVSLNTLKTPGMHTGQILFRSRTDWSPITCFQTSKEKDPSGTLHYRKYSFDLHDRRRMPMILLNNILGGPGMSARLNLALRERSGYAYNVESHFTAYSNTGIFTVYFGTDKEKLDRCRSACPQGI